MGSFFSLLMFFCFHTIFLFAENANIEPTKYGIKPNKVFFLQENIDLEGKTLRLPPGVTIHLRGGQFSNGTLVTMFAI